MVYRTTLFIFPFLLACSGPSGRPSLGERQPNGREGSLVGSPCENPGTPIAIAGDLVGFSVKTADESGMRGASFEASLVGVRKDRMKVDIDGKLLAAPQPMTIDLADHQNYQSCRACVTLALEGGIELVAMRGRLDVRSYEPGQGISAVVSDVTFQEFDRDGNAVISGCTLTFTGPASLSITPEPAVSTGTEELGSMTLVDILNARGNGSLIGLLTQWAGSDLAYLMQSASIDMWQSLAGWADYFGLELGPVMQIIGPTATYLILYGMAEFVPLFL
jgi:hypothetical protein